MITIPETYRTKHHWPANSGIQYGITHYKKGAVIFFEGVPQELDTLIRGTGQTVEKAEQVAWNLYLQYLTCQQTRNHEFVRSGYTNGGGICCHCGMFRIVFEPIEGE